MGPRAGGRGVVHWVLMRSARRLNYTYQDYLHALGDSHIKLEYCDGQIYAMAGGTPTHAELGMRVGHFLMQALPSTCRAYSSDLRVRVEASDLSTFPDVTVVCGQRETSAVDENAVTNPTVLVEVTSPSTEAYDRGEKLAHYKQLPSLRAVLLVSHRERRVTEVRRDAHGQWTERDVGPGQQVELGAPDRKSVV